MGQDQSNPTECDIGKAKLSDNEFQLALDSQAFEFHMLAGVKSIRISELSLKGKWLPQKEDVYTDKRPFINKYLQIAPGKDKEANLTVLEKGVNYLYKSNRSSVKPILCSSGPNSSVVYINMILRRQELKVGNYTSIDEDMILLTPESILIVNLPDEITKPTLSFLAEKSFDATLLSFGSKPIS
jgi:hypothetical protein